MKKINHYVLNGAIVLLSTAGFVACSSSDDVTDAPVNPTYDGKSVKTQFAINIATPGSKNQTRMTSDNTQMAGSKFLGMQNIYLFPLTLESLDGPTSSTNVSSIIPLGSIDANNNAMHIDGSDKDYKVYNDVNVAVGTNNFLFYGEGPSGTNMNSNFEKGKLTANVNGKSSVGNINFKPVQIAAQSTYSSIQNEFVSYLNGIVGASHTDGANTTNWNNMGDNLTGDKAVLKGAYDNFIKLKAGSAVAILASVQSLYNIVKPISENASSDAQDLANAICTKILNTDGTNIKLKESSETSGPTYILSYDSSDKDYTEFPETQGLPQGAMILEYSPTSTPAFSYKTTSANIGTTDNNINVDNIVYPACIEYFVNTPLKATNSDDITWPTTANTWDNDVWENWGNVVLPSTRTIALQNTINYGVSSLRTTIKAVTETGLLEDNQKHFYNDLENQQVAVGKGFTVTGILIGGQPAQVEWNFLSSSDNFNYTVFDRSMPIGENGNITVIAKNYSDDNETSEPFYTLLLDNMLSGDNATQKDVNFAIELTNTSNTDFYGFDGVVAAGQKFYLVGKMSVSEGQSITFPADNDYRFPGIGTKRIFVQDYTTNLNVTFKSLKNAYVTIPDLRASNLQLGLSVDLEWKTGLTYDVTIE
ncbi:MAG: hypothetical protein ACI3YQ_11770 [Prevotella sp.]